MSSQPMARALGQPSRRERLTRRLTLRVWRRSMVLMTYLAVASLLVFMPLVHSWKLNPLIGWAVSALLVLVAVAGLSAEWFWLTSRANWWGMWRSNRKALRWEELRARGATAQEIDAALIRVDDVDERQRAVLDRAYRYAYWILAAVGGAVLLYGITGNGLIPKDLRLGLFHGCSDAPDRVRRLVRAGPPGRNLGCSGRRRFRQPQLLDRLLAHLVLLHLAGDRHREAVHELPVARDLIA